MKLHSIKIDKFSVAANVFSFGYLGYIRAKDIVSLPCFSDVKLRGELLNVMWLVPLLSLLYMLFGIGNFIRAFFMHSVSLCGPLVDILYIYLSATVIFQIIVSLLSMQVARKIDFQNHKDKIKFVMFGLSSGKDLIDNIKIQQESISVQKSGGA